MNFVYVTGPQSMASRTALSAYVSNANSQGS